MRIDPTEMAALAARAAETLQPESESPLLLICEHAAADIPSPWGGLGLDSAFMDTHYAYDPGAATVTRHLSASLGAPAVLSRYSRIFLDYNRFPSDWDYMRPDLGGIPVPANRTISAEERDLRRTIAVDPVYEAIEESRSGRRAVVSIHSFTPVMAGDERNVDVAFLWKEDNAFTRIALDELHNRAPEFGLRPGDNAPYDLRKVDARSLKTHAADHGLPYIYVEVNNSLFSNPETTAQACALLDEVLRAVLRREAEWATNPV